MTRGKFIVLEGGEGAGKTGCLKYLRTALATEDIIFTHEPGGTPMAEQIREVLLGHYDEPVDPLTEILLFAASRRQHVDQVIRPALDAGRHVISDRYVASSYAYQICAGGREAMLEPFTLANQWATGGCHPDLYIILDLDPAVGRERVAGREEKISRFDAKDLEYHQCVRQGYLQFVATCPSVVIDASRSKEAVNNEALAAVRRCLNQA